MIMVVQITPETYAITYQTTRRSLPEKLVVILIAARK
jgi:hypothetical protein